MRETIERVGVIGLGAMGSSLAAHLLREGFTVQGFDVAAERTKRLAPQGLVAAASPKQAAAGADLVLLSLRNWEIVREVVEGPEGIESVLEKGQIVADSSTVPPAETRKMALRLRRRGVEWLDTPISGAANQAREGNMVFMVGGPRPVFERVEPVLSRIAKKVVYAGNNGDAATMKLVVNLTLFLNQAAAVEGLTLGLKSGLDTSTLLDVLISGAAGSNLLEARGRDMVEGRFDPKGPVWLGIKDLGLALEGAEEIGVSLPVAGLYRQLMLAAHYAGWDEEDATVVMRLYDRLFSRAGS